MALRILSLLLLAAAAEDALPVPAQNEQAAPLAASPSSNTTWHNFVYCNCGLSCVKEMGSWYIFNVGKSCGCEVCEETNANLRGSEPSSGEEPLSPVKHETSGGAKNPESLKSSPGMAAEHESSESSVSSEEGKSLKSLKSSSLPLEETTAGWDGARVPGTNLLYCNLLLTKIDTVVCQIDDFNSPKSKYFWVCKPGFHQVVFV